MRFQHTKQGAGSPGQDLPLSAKIKKDWLLNRSLYALFIPVLVYYIIFQYGPMFGLIISFENYKPATGFLHSRWVGFKHFNAFFHDFYFQRVLMNTIRISITNLVFTFPMPIILALLINDLRTRWFSRTVQTITYIPHFISIVVTVSIMKDLTTQDGAISLFLAHFGWKPVSMLNDKAFFIPLYVISNIWQNMGWNCIIYLSALLAIDQELYEAAKIDGAGKFRQLVSVTIPCLLPTIVIMLIMQIGKMFNIGYEKILLMYNPLTYEVADVISTYVYRKGLLEMNWSYSAAVGMFNSIVSFALVWGANKFSKKVAGSSLW